MIEIKDSVTKIYRKPALYFIIVSFFLYSIHFLYTIEEIKKLKPDRIILSPGPGRPEDAGIIIEIIKKLGKNIPILGVCLGHQAI